MLKTILSISGKPGLYKLVSRNRQNSLQHNVFYFLLVLNFEVTKVIRKSGILPS